ncbi:hypothetical protein ACFC1R_18190 [Kitasatospora sp. NPDC056138]
MTGCTAAGAITLNGESIAVICDLPPHDGNQHHDVVHGDWTSTPDD